MSFHKLSFFVLKRGKEKKKRNGGKDLDTAPLTLATLTLLFNKGWRRFGKGSCPGPLDPIEHRDSEKGSGPRGVLFSSLSASTLPTTSGTIRTKGAKGSQVPAGTLVVKREEGT